MKRGRPLNPQPKQTAAGTWSVEVPAAPAAARRVRRTFATEAEARSWIKAAVAALQAGRAVAEPGSVPAPGTDFASVASSYVEERYGKLRRAKAARRKQVESIIDNHLVPLMSDKPDPTVCVITRDDYIGFLSELAQGTGPAASATPVATGGIVTVAEAVEMTGACLSTIKRRIAAGAFPGSLMGADGKRRIPVKDLSAAGLLADMPLRRGPRHDAGYAQQVIGDIRRILDAIIKYGVATAGWTIDFDFGVNAIPNPISRAKKVIRRQVTFAECVAMAPYLHPVHQTVLWMIRLLSLRISEAYGPRVDDVVDAGKRGLIRIDRQGGRNFLVDGDDGHVRSTGAKDEMKTASSTRVLLVPAPLMGVIRAVIDVFHTDEGGHVRTGARLIPGLALADESGQAAFRTALRSAARQAGVSLGDATDAELDEALLPVPKDMRAGTITDLAWGDVDELVRKRWAGHVAGRDVHAKHYVLDHPDIKKLVPAARQIEKLAQHTSPGGLMIPTTKSCTTGNQAALYPDRGRIDAKLLAIGWATTETGPNGEAMMTVHQTADLFGIDVIRVRKWAAKGRFGDAARATAGAYRLPTTAVLAEFERWRNRRRLADVATDLDITYHRALWWVNRERLVVHRVDGALLVPPDTEQRLRALRDQEDALLERAAPFEDAAEAMGITPVAVECLIRQGVLEVDPERGPNNARYVTRASIAGARKAS